MYIDEDGNKVCEVGEQVYDMFNRLVVITRVGMSASRVPKFIYEVGGIEVSDSITGFRSLEEGPFPTPTHPSMINDYPSPMNKDISVGQEVYVKNGVLTTVKRIFKDVDLFYRAYFDIDGEELWSYVIDCRTLEEGPAYYQTPPPVFNKGDQMYAPGNNLVTLKRIETDGDGFLRFFYDLDDQVDLWAYSVYCRTLGQGPTSGPNSRSAK